MANTQQWQSIGRRKCATARVYLRPGSGKIVINREECDDYFGRGSLQMIVRQPLELVEMPQAFDVLVNVAGGGKAGQAGAIKLGIARALIEFDGKLRPALKRAGFLTRDARIVERKKYGQPGARKRFQFSKR
jgi:small subunit ribosomal protein S9